MAASADAICLARKFGVALGLILVTTCLPGHAQTRISLAQLGFRKAPDYVALHTGHKVIVRGVVSTPARHFAEYSTLAIQDSNNGGILKVSLPDKLLDRYHPGEEVEAQGTVVMQYGMAMLVPDKVTLVGRTQVPQAKDLSLRDLQSAAHLGELVRTQGTVLEKPAYNSGGAVMLLAGRSEPYRLFIPRAPGAPKTNLEPIRKGDTIRVAGIALQYSPTTPHDSGYELLVADIGDIVVVERSPAVPQPVIASGIAVVLLVGFFLWSRERRLRAQRRRLRRTYKLGEEILGAASTAAILKRLSEALPGILGVTRVRLYVYNRAAKALDVIEDAIEDGGAAPESISLTSPPGGTPAGAVACFHYRTLLVIPDIDRSPFPVAARAGTAAPKSLLFVPMIAQSEVIGVLELDQDDRMRDFSADEQALAQHLGNQIGVAIRLLDQRSVQEQLFRTEKMAAVGRLISGVVNELQTPLASILNLAHRALEKTRGGAAERDVSAIATEANKASGIVSRLVSYAAAERVEAQPVDVSALVRTMIEFREGDWKASGIRVRDLTARESLFVLGSQGQLEQVFLNLFVHVEQSLVGAEQKSIVIRTSTLAKRLLVEISFTSPSELRKPEDTAAVLGVTRSVIAGHGGEVRLIEKGNADPRFEVELPVLARERGAPPSVGSAPPRDSSGRMTALVIEPDEASQRQLLVLLSGHGFRVVPVKDSDSGLDLAHRMRFDVALCSLHAPGLNWVELSERMYSRVGGFILLSDGYDAELSADFEGDGRFVLPKPLQEKELERVLRLIEPPTATVIPFKTGSR
jgi:GAF domain-containing protein